MPVPCDPFIRTVLRDESLTRGLEDPEARMLIEWLADWVELLVDASRTEEEAQRAVQRLCLRAKIIARFVQWWNDLFTRSAALQLAATQRCDWPLPTGDIEALDLMHHILTWENQHPGA